MVRGPTFVTRIRKVIREQLRRKGIIVLTRSLRGPIDSFYKGYDRDSLDRRLFFNLGAAGFEHPYWTNLDYASEAYRGSQKVPFINLNLMDEPDWPIESATAEIVYTSHTIEHIDNAAALKAFQEAFRVLKPGGLLRVTCPDADTFYECLRLGRTDYWQHWRQEIFEQGSNGSQDLSTITVEDYVVREVATERCRFTARDPSRILTPAETRTLFESCTKTELFDAVTAGCCFATDRPEWHINWWNHEKLKTLLRQAGFEHPMSSGFGKSLTAPLQDIRWFDSTFPVMSLYVEAGK